MQAFGFQAEPGTGGRPVIELALSDGSVLSKNLTNANYDIDNFFGFISLDGISSFTLTNNAIGGSIGTSLFGNFVYGVAADNPTDPDPIPEPSTMLLLGTGIVGLIGIARRRMAGKK